MADPTAPIAADEVRVYYAHSDVFEQAALAQRYLPSLSEEERTRYARFHFDHDRQSYLAAHALTRSLLAPLCGGAPAELCFDLGEHGKPELRLPAGSPPLRFNLSHTRGLVACALSLERAVGVDVERLDRRVEIDQLAASVFSPDERAGLQALAGEDRRQRFFQLWTLKEAYIKAVGRGLSLPLRSISLDVTPAAGPTIAFSPPIEDDGRNWWFAMRNLSAQHALGVAVNSDAPVRALIEAWRFD